MDRQFMVVDHKRRLLTARKHPNMVLIDVSVVDNKRSNISLLLHKMDL